MANIGEQVDILKFLPNHLIGTTTGLFLKAIQDYVNQMYEYKKDPTSSKCSISESQYKDRVSLLGKIKGLAELHDAKQVDHEFIGRIADLLGFDFGISMSEMMDMISVLSVPEGTSVPLDIETGTMVDVLPIPASACGIADPADKATEFMRHILVELPYWFQIKGTDKLAKIFFWCFGLMMKWEYGYTRNYSNKNSDWVYTENKNDVGLVESGMIPTPHVRASFSLDDSFADSYALVSWLNSQGLSRVVTTLTSIKPINAVIEDVVFSFDFNEVGRSLKGLAVNMSLGIDNYHRFKDWYSSDNIWDGGVGAVDPISFSLKKIPVGYTFRDQQIGEILEGSYNTTVSGSVNASGANPSDIVFTLSSPVNYYAQEGINFPFGTVFYPSDLYPTVDSLPVGATVYDKTDGVLKQLIFGYKWTPRNDPVVGWRLIECSVGSHAGRIIKVKRFSTTGKYFFVSDDGGISWTSRDKNFKAAFFDNGCECLLSSNTNRIVVGGISDSFLDGVFALSDDNGDTWSSVVVAGVGEIQSVNSFGYGKLVAMTRTHSLVSSNGGLAWSSYAYPSEWEEILSYGNIVKCNYGPRVGRLVYAYSYTDSDTESRVIISDDGGVTWTKKPTPIRDYVGQDVIECRYGNHVGRLVVVGSRDPYVVVVMLAGCGSSRPALGDAVMGPDGWLEYCQRHPEDRDCG